MTQSKLQQLIDTIQYHDYLYFTKESPEISDEEYDQLWFELDELRQTLDESELPESLSQIKQSMPLGVQLSHLEKIQHEVFVGSLDKMKMDAKNFPKLLDKWASKYDSHSGFMIESKLDGLTIVIYRHAEGPVFVTRGGNQKGENVTHQFIHRPEIYNAALKLPIGCAARGEGIIASHNFEQSNQNVLDQLEEMRPFYDETIALHDPNSHIEMYLYDVTKASNKEFMAEYKATLKHVRSQLDKRGKALLKSMLDLRAQFYANARNLSSATLRHKTTSMASERRVDLIMYDIINSKEMGIQTETESLQLLENAGFTIADNHYVNSKQELIEWFETLDNAQKMRDESLYDIDGLVIKPDKKLTDPKITGHHVEGQIALKYPPAVAKSKLLEVVWQPGKEGVLTPVGIFEPVVIKGSTIQRASLASLKTIQDLDLHHGDDILVARANDVIPQIIKAYPEFRDADAQPVLPPENTYMNGAYVVDTSYEMPTHEKLSKFAEHMEIDNASGATFKKIEDAGFITDIPSIYSLSDHVDELYEIKGLGNKSIDSLIAEIEKSKNSSFDKVLNGLSLPNLGQSSVRKLVEIWPTFDDFQNATEEEIETFCSARGVNVNSAKTFRSLVEDHSILSKLSDQGVEF